jgi:hypothetical protein
MNNLLSNFVLASVVAVVIAGTGCGSIYGGGGGPTIDVEGNVDEVLPAPGDRDIVVFVFTLRDPLPDCSEPELPEEGTQYQSRILQPGETVFDVQNAKAGSIVVAFLLDNPGRDADAEIDPGDPVAILEDPNCVMDDVPNKYIVNAADVDINFTLTNPVDFPAAGRAEANPLTEAPE